MTWIHDPMYVSGMLCIIVLLSVWLAKFKGWKTLGTPILVILFAALAANVGIIPTAATGNPVYNGVFIYLAPMGIFIALLEVDLKSLRKAGATMLLMFSLGGLGTIIGVLVAWFLVRPAEAIGPMANAVAGMFTGTYIGGSINFNAIALSYHVNENPDLYAATTVVDSLIGTVWIIATLILPKYLQSFFPRKKLSPTTGETQKIKQAESISIAGLASVLGIAFLAMAVSKLVSQFFPEMPEIITLTSIALMLAQIPFVKRLSGTHTLGFFLILLFLAAIGTLCDLSTLYGLGDLAGTLFLFVGLLVLVHGAVIFGIGALFKVDWDVIAVASQANVGGNTTALASAESLNRPDLLIPGVLVGSLGNALGTYAGFFIAGVLM
ncbi:DUF819 domain-containing protein [Algoriphagus winogradskyi]|uniref:Uncharacterized membrane protein n=1 Tax=Algoriphagus winogradskyi TaxID=237017 RepID=A0ABY1NXZ0_9BACT|nr:DUF819 family protein [Algoriphagus winogradskyi]SMP21562.1 Uncharacterized membrane protein [Algoriphagus winogradskyi]